jgi:adenylosuccinate synthase
MIVIGLGFGDEGKGLTTSYLCSKVENPLVVRFNGGHQAGHTVVKDGVRHVSSTYGAGALYNIPTYISQYCTFFPTAMVNEFLTLSEDKSVAPKLMVHPLCPVTTPYDLAFNQKIEDERGTRRHGSVGVGFGATIQRQEDYYTLYVKDLKYPKILKAKLDNIARYYNIEVAENIMLEYLQNIKWLLNIIEIKDYAEVKEMRYDLVLEGAQGVLLDQDHGFFPNVTRSNTTSKNAIDVWTRLSWGLCELPEIYYVTRTYQTRHGAGFMTNEGDINGMLKNNEDETNVSHDYQGDFRIGSLDTDLLNYALEIDKQYHHFELKKNLVVTCMDQYKIPISVLLHHLDTKFNSVLISNGPSREDITEKWLELEKEKQL